MKRLFLSLTFAFLVSIVQAQLWQADIIPMTVPPPNFETELNGYDIQETSDGNYVFAGNFKTGISPNFSYSPTLVKLNANTGAVMWTKIYPVFTSGEMQEVSLVEKPNGHLLLAGLEFDSIFLIEADALGDTLSTHRIMSACELANGVNCNVATVRLRATFDGNYILCIGGSGDMAGSATPLSQLIKIAPNNNIIWNKTYQNRYILDAQPTSDGGYIMSGCSLNFTGLVFKVDMNGDSIWQQIYTGQLMENLNSIKQTADNGYVISYDLSGFAGYSPYLMKVDSNGANILWQTPLGLQTGNVYHVIEDSNGNYAATGRRYVPHGGGALQNLYIAFITKVSPSGTVLQEQVFDDLIDNEGKAVRFTSDGNFVIAGSHAHTLRGVLDKGYVVKTEYLLHTTMLRKETPSIQISPNPMKQEATLVVNSLDYLRLKVLIFDALGRQVQQVQVQNGTRITIHRKNLGTGLYFFKLFGDGKPIGNGKLVVK